MIEFHETGGTMAHTLQVRHTHNSGTSHRRTHVRAYHCYTNTLLVKVQRALMALV